MSVMMTHTAMHIKLSVTTLATTAAEMTGVMTAVQGWFCCYWFPVFFSIQSAFSNEGLRSSGFCYTSFYQFWAASAVRASSVELHRVFAEDEIGM